MKGKVAGLRELKSGQGAREEFPQAAHMCSGREQVAQCHKMSLQS